MKVQSHTRWVEDMTFVGTGFSGRSVVMDAAKDFGGHESAAKPVELLLLGLAGCTGMDVVSLLRKMRVDFTGIDLNIEAEKAEEHPAVFTRIDLEYVITGRNVDEALVKKAVGLSQDKYCAVSAMLRKSCPVDYTIRIVEA